MHVWITLTLLTASTLAQGLHMVKVIPLENPTHAEEFKCIAEPNPEDSDYSWFRQGSVALPQEVMAEGDRLHFLTSSPDLNGLYICKVVNQFGQAQGSLYRHNRIHTEL